MLKFLSILFAILFLTTSVPAQEPDSTVEQPDEVLMDTSLQAPIQNTIAPLDTIIDSVAITPPAQRYSLKPRQDFRQWLRNDTVPLLYDALAHHPYYDFGSKPIRPVSNVRIVHGRELVFYVIVGLIFLFAVLKITFAKYFTDLFRVFFRTTMKQRQIREQLMQTPLPSLAFNFFFVASAGFYLNIILHYFNIEPVDHFWLMYLYCCAGLAIIYLVKFIGLKIVGWLFNLRAAADAYIFIVFIINKMIGIFLLPFILVLAFAGPTLHDIALGLSWIGVGLLFSYRFLLGFSSIRNSVKINGFHFLLYLIAFEVAPLYLIYKLLLGYI